MKSIIRITTFFLVLFSIFSCVSGGGNVDNARQETTSQPQSNEHELTVEEIPYIEADIEVFLQLGHGSSVYSIAYSIDNKIIISGSSNAVKLWDIMSGRELKTYNKFPLNTIFKDSCISLVIIL